MGGNSISNVVRDTVLSRRSFLKWSVALGGTAALAGGITVGLKTSEKAQAQAPSQGKWVVAACWNNCEGDSRHGLPGFTHARRFSPAALAGAATYARDRYRP